MTKVYFTIAILAFIPDGCATYEAPPQEIECVSWDCEYGCGCDAYAVEAAVGESNVEHWHARYVADNCERCPECCVQVPQLEHDILEEQP